MRRDGAKPWMILVNDQHGVHTPAYARTRREAEEFAASRSSFRRDVFLLVLPTKTHVPGSGIGWVSAYRNGSLHDQMGRGAYDPRRSVRKPASRDGAKRSPAARRDPAARLSRKQPALMTAAEINRELDRLDRQRRRLTDEFIEAGRGRETASETQKLDDPLARRWNAITGRAYDLRNEITLRYGPDAPSRLPRDFGPRTRRDAAKRAAERPAPRARKARRDVRRRDPAPRGTSPSAREKLASQIVSDRKSRRLLPRDLQREYGLTAEQAEKIFGVLEGPYAQESRVPNVEWYLRPLAERISRDRSSSRELTDSARHISHGFYRVSDREAGALARGAGKPLPRHGMELRVELPDGRLAWLSRTPAKHLAPTRGWVWSVSGVASRDRGSPRRSERGERSPARAKRGAG